MKFEDLIFTPHPTLGDEILRAKYQGFSIIYSPPLNRKHELCLINDYEIMFPNGEVASGFNQEGVEETINLYLRASYKTNRQEPC